MTDGGVHVWKPFDRVTWSNRSRQLTRARRRAHSKKAPLSLRLSEYVSGGGGRRRSRTMVGICSRTRSVMGCVATGYGTGASWRNGSPSVSIDVT